MAFDEDRFCQCLNQLLADGHSFYLGEPLHADLGAFDGPPAQCHANAARWVEQHPSAQVEKGWLFQYQGAYVRHSVVRTGEGRLLDVTIREAGFQPFHKFILHEAAAKAYGGALPEFGSMVPIVSQRLPILAGLSPSAPLEH